MQDNDKQLKSSSFVPAELDTEFILGESMRGMPLHMEFAKVEERLQNWGISSTVVVFGSARTAVVSGQSKSQDKQFSRWYCEARHLAKIVSEHGGAMVPANGTRHPMERGTMSLPQAADQG